MAESNWKSSATDTLGFVLAVAIFGLLGYGAYLGVRQFVSWTFPQAPEASLSLSAHFDGPTFLVGGQVQQQGKAIIEGKVRITVERTNGDYRQSVLLELSPAGFLVKDYPAFGWVTRCEPIRVIAEAWSTQLAEPIREHLYMNAGATVRERPRSYAFAMAASIAFLLVFLTVFTGKRTPRKNRVAIVMSYCVIIIFLAVPLLAPFVIVRAFPDILEGMKESPVGLVVAKAEDNPDSNPQWVLNIGGYVKRHNLPCPENTAPLQNPIIGNSQPSPAGGVVQAAKETPTDTTGSATASIPTENPSANGPADLAVVSVQGGLTIPLYVVLLSVLGGAINMTRQLPKFQKAGERAEALNLQNVKGAVMALFKKSDNPNVESSQQSDSSGSETPPSEEGPHEEWRTGLLNQYMFLISAPFLAIATYYLLFWLDLNKVPVLVLVSFSVGLITEPVLRAITKRAETFISTPDAAGVPAP